MRNSRRVLTLSALLAAGVLTSGLRGQDQPPLYSRSAPSYGVPESTTPPSFGKSAPVPLPQGSNGHQQVDKTDIETFVKHVAGAGKGPIIESERERIISEFERQFNVYLHDRDVLVTSDMDAKSLVNALNNSVNQSNTNAKENQLQFTVRRGLRSTTAQSFDDLEPYNKQAYLNSMRFGNIPQGVKLPGLTPGVSGYAGYGTNDYYAPSGSQKNIGLTQDYQSQVRRSPYAAGGGQTAKYPATYKEAQARGANRPLVNNSGIPDEVFFKMSQDPQLPAGGATILRSIDERATEYYSNGQPRFDENGNEIYPNGSRKFDDRGVPLYSNGMPKVDAQGNRLHSNGLPMSGVNGEALYPNGTPRTTSTGVALYQDGSRRLGGDGRNPTQVLSQYGRPKTADQVDLGAKPGVMPAQPVSPRQALSGRTVPSRSDEVQQQLTNRSQPLFQGGQAMTTEQGVKLHPNGMPRFGGDGRGSAKEPEIPRASGTDAGLTKRLYPNAQSASDDRGNRLYSNGMPRSDQRGRPLYASGQRLVTADSGALTTSGDRIVGERGFQGRPQGVFEMYHLFDGQIVQVDKTQMVLKPRGAEEITFNIEEAAVARDDRDGFTPGTIEQLAPRLNVQVIGTIAENFIDGRKVGSADVARAVCILASNPRVGRQMEDGSYPVAYVISGSVSRLTPDRLYLRPNTGPMLVELQIDDNTQLQKKQLGEIIPASIQTVGVGRRVDVIVQQDVRMSKQRLHSTGPQRVLAVIQR